MFGTGMGTAFFKLMSDLYASVETKNFINSKVVLADWIFTTPSVIIQPITGIWLLVIMKIPFTTNWVIYSFVLYAIAGLCWLPVLFMQMSMLKITKQALKESKELPKRYFSYVMIWSILGFIAFWAMLMIVYLMVFKPL